MYHVHLRIVDTMRAELYLGWVPRAISAATTALFIFAAYGEDRIYWFPALLAAVALIGLLYDEHWTFDTATGVISSRLGLAPWPRRKRYALTSLRAVGIAVIGARPESTNPLEQNPIPSVFTRGHCRLELRFTDRPTILVTLERATHRARLEAIAQSLAGQLGVDYFAADDSAAASETKKQETK